MLRKELSIHTFSDMLFVFPFRYIDRSNLHKIKDIESDGSPVQLLGRIVFSEDVGEGRSRRLVAHFKDTTGSIELVWFKASSMIEKMVTLGGDFLVYGKATRFNGVWNISHPELEKIEAGTLSQLPAFQPVYPSTEKLRQRWLSGKNYVQLVKSLFDLISNNHIEEILPNTIVKEYQLMGRFEALKAIHFPENQNEIERATYRLKFEELFVHQIGICKLKLNHALVQGFAFHKVGDYFNEFYKQHLPFELTEDQKMVLREIRFDTQTGHQMNRLLQGDVGSGKTIVALLCMLLALDNGFQTCLMAPTEILAQQHAVGISELLAPLGLQIGYLTGKVKAKAKREVLAGLADGRIRIVIGTHALIEDTVVFQNLGLCIIDEQHRFGVAQRAKLWKKNILPPHILVMTATPIPRTLAMTSYGDLEVSVIKNLPPGRKPISTIHRSEMHRAKVMDFIRSEIDLGRQAYIVYPLIEESEKVDYENLMAGYEQVKQFFPPHKYNIAMVHGKQEMSLRESNMNSFVKGNAQILVATTVIEVGVNVPNASVMLIENAERFGLSQLHQLRGRVGRGADKSFCILLTSPKISTIGKERMHTMVTETSGFAISEKDLELRGPGDIDGLRQSGGADLKLADIVKDVALMATTRQVAIELLKEDADLMKPEHANLKSFLLQRKDKEVWSRIS
ncbi:MAG: ATP-dependent DNA helicase RecG [Chitinophagaceae bacterium]|nr:ATP-dependent DNA helicase RecG [Chitinophagaceae bacterium]